MQESINEQVSVIAAFAPSKRGATKVVPHVMLWGGKRYRMEQMGLYFPERRGTKQIHIFSFLSEGTTFRLELDPETLLWTLIEAYYES